MPIPQEHMARRMDLKKAMEMTFWEASDALRESYADLTDEQLRARPLEGHNHILSMVMHCLKQQDDYNGLLQWRRGEAGPVREWHFLPTYECFDLWGLDHRLPGPEEEPAITVAQVLEMQATMEAAIRRSFDLLAPEDVQAPTEGSCPQLCDWWFRAAYHINAHVRQIWHLRGLMGLKEMRPEQNYA